MEGGVIEIVGGAAVVLLGAVGALFRRRIDAAERGLNSRMDAIDKRCVEHLDKLGLESGRLARIEAILEVTRVDVEYIRRRLDSER